MPRLLPTLDQAIHAPLLALIDDLPPSYREDALLALAPLLPQERLEALAQQAQQEASEDALEHAAALTAGIAPYLPANQRDSLLRQVLSGIQHLAPREQAAPLLHVLPRLTGDLQTKAIQMASQQPRVEPHAGLLLALLPHLPAEQQPGIAQQLTGLAPKVGGYAQRVEIVRAIIVQKLATPALAALLEEMAHTIGDPGFRAHALVLLLPCLGRPEQPAAAQAIASACQSIFLAGDRLEVLAQAAPYGDLVPDWNRLFADAFQGAYAHHRAQALLRVLPTLAEEKRPSHLAQAATQLAQWVWTRDANRGAHDRSETWEALVTVWRTLAPPSARTVWRDALPALANRSRADLYLDLAAIAPLLPVLGGETAAAEIAQAVVDVSQWWP